MTTDVGQRIEVVERDLPGWKGQVWLLRDTVTGKHYVASGVDAMFSGWEVLVFEADEKGNVKEWNEVAGGRGITHEAAIADLTDVVSA